jgi:hypothetical protein
VTFHITSGGVAKQTKNDSAQLQDLQNQRMMCCVCNTSLIAARDHVCDSIHVLHGEGNDYLQFLIGKVVFKHMLRF